MDIVALVVAVAVMVALVAFNVSRNKRLRAGYANDQAALYAGLAAQPDLSMWSDQQIVNGHFTDMLHPGLQAEYERRGLTP